MSDPYSSMDTTPEAMKREGSHPPPPPPPPRESPSLKHPLHPWAVKSCLTQNRREQRPAAPGPSALPSTHTCVFLRQHGPAYNLLEGGDPLQLVVLCLTGKEEFPVWGDDGDPVLPVVPLCGRWEPFQHLVAVFLAPNKNLPSSKGILG